MIVALALGVGLPLAYFGGTAVAVFVLRPELRRFILPAYRRARR